MNTSKKDVYHSIHVKESNIRPENVKQLTPKKITASRGEFKEFIKIKWQPTIDTMGYIVFRSKTHRGPYRPVSGIIREDNYTDTSAKTGIYYWYRVRSVRRFRLSKSSPYVQGWTNPHMPGGGEKMIKVFLRLIRSVPHFYRIRKLAIKRQKELPSSLDVKQLVPSNTDIFETVQKICAPPHRRIGSPESLLAENYVMGEFQSILGKNNVSKDPVECDVYEATNWKLEIETDNGVQEIDAFYTVNTGITYDKNPRGGIVTGNMVWAGGGTLEDIEKLGDNLSGKIVVALCQFPDFPIGLLKTIFNGFYHTSDPTNSLNSRSKRSFTFVRKNFPAEYTEERNNNSIYWMAHDRGAEGLILILNNHPGKVNTHWGPYAGKMKSMPCMYVDHYMKDEIKKLAESGARASITLEGNLRPGAGHNIYGVLPGKSKKTILVSSHHDAPFKGATEDGTGVATLLALAKTWVQVPFENREKTMVFVSTTGHFYGGKGAKEFAGKHKNDILKNLMICINVEHTAALEYIDDGKGNMVPNGEQALNFIFVNEDLTAIAAARQMLQKHKPEKSVLVQSNLLGPVPPGEAGHYHMYTGVSIIHWIGQPYYVLTDDDTLDKVDIDKLNPIACGIADLIGTFVAL
jgi:hypothetical protein